MEIVREDSSITEITHAPSPSPSPTPTQGDGREAIEEAYPALARLGWRERRRRIPHVQQQEWSDCAAACVASVLGYHGQEVSLAEVRERMAIGRDGLTAADVLALAGRFELSGRGVRVELEELHLLPRASILHWEFNHFVVLDRLERGTAHIVDPAYGPRAVAAADLARSFTGVALVLEPSRTFSATRSVNRPRRLRGLLGELLAEGEELRRILLISLFLRLFALSTPLLLGVVVDRVVPRGDFDLLAVVAAGLGGMLLFEALSRVVRAHLLLLVRTRMDTRMTLGFLEHMVSLPFSFFQRRSTGDLMMRVHSNATVREILTANSFSALLDGAFVSLYLVVIAWVSPMLALLAGCFTVANAAVFVASRRRYHRLMVRELEAQAKSRGELVQIIEGIQTLKCGGVEQRAVQNWSALYVEELNVALRRSSLTAWVDAAREFLQSAAPLTLLAVGAVLVVDAQLSIGTMLAVNALASGVFGPISSLVASALQLQLLGGYMERIEDVLQSGAEQGSAAAGAAAALPPPLRGQLAAYDLRFRYASGASVIEDLSIEVPAGCSLAIVGSSGSGKSTLASLLVGLYQPQQGAVYFDGMPLRDLELRAVRQQIGIVPQHPYIFSGTVRDNIALTLPGASMEEVERAARIACIHDEIVHMPMAYQTLLDAGGSSISGGQRQRIAIARAIIGHPPILLLDEATSALDALTESAVMHNLSRLGCTRLIIAHRLSTVAGADLIVVLEGGRIVEAGSHTELLASRGKYFELVSRQSEIAPPRAREMAL